MKERETEREREKEGMSFPRRELDSEVRYSLSGMWDNNDKMWDSYGFKKWD